MFFLEHSCYFNDPADIGNLISGSSAFSKPSWTSGSSRFMYCWSLTWRILSITLHAGISLMEIVALCSPPWQTGWWARVQSGDAISPVLLLWGEATDVLSTVRVPESCEDGTLDPLPFLFLYLGKGLQSEKNDKSLRIGGLFVQLFMVSFFSFNFLKRLKYSWFKMC